MRMLDSAPWVTSGLGSVCARNSHPLEHARVLIALLHMSLSQPTALVLLEIVRMFPAVHISRAFVQLTVGLKVAYSRVAVLGERTGLHLHRQPAAVARLRALMEACRATGTCTPC